MTCTAARSSLPSLYDLHAELTPAEESAYILRRKQIWEEMNGPVGGQNFPTNDLRADGRRKGEQHHKQFAAEVAEVAEVTGSSKRDVNLKIARARELGPDISRIVGTTLDKGVEMDLDRSIHRN